MIKDFLSNTFYVKVKKNTFHIRHIESKKEIEVYSTSPFSTISLLVGEFSVASDLLKKNIKEISKRSSKLVTPVIIMHPLEMIDGGLSQVETRTLNDLAKTAEAREVLIWTGAELSDKQVLIKIDKLVKSQGPSLL